MDITQPSSSTNWDAAEVGSLPRRTEQQRPELAKGRQTDPPPEPAVPEAFPPGLVQRPSLELLARVRDGLVVLDAPAPSMWRGMWQ